MRYFYSRVYLLSMLCTHLFYTSHVLAMRTQRHAPSSAGNTCTVYTSTTLKPHFYYDTTMPGYDKSPVTVQPYNGPHESWNWTKKTISWQIAHAQVSPKKSRLN